MAHPYADELDFVRTIAQKAAAMARAFQKNGFTSSADKTEGDPYLTEADLALDAYLKQAVTQKYPADGWLSEETKTDASNLARPRCWIVDPIDGTRDFINRTGDFTISIGLVENGKPVLGCVVAPMHDQVFTGVVGAGAWLNDKPARLNTPPAHLADALCDTSKRDTVKGLWKPFEGKLKLKQVGSIAYKLVRPVAGLSDLTISLTPKNLWDGCGGHAVAEAAGLKVCDLYGKPITYTPQNLFMEGIIACPASLYPAIRAMLDEAQAL